MDFKISTIHESKILKRKARDKKVHLRGPTSEVFSERIVPILRSIIEEAINTHRGWLESEWKEQTAQLRVKKEVSFTEALPYFQKTLKKRVKLCAHTMGKPVETLVEDQHLIERLCEQAALDFIMSLRISVQEGETLTNALEIAGLSHWLNPMDIKRLGKKYQDRVDTGVIKSIAIGSPKNPDVSIDRYIEARKRLGEKYNGRVNNYVINRAALVYSKNPDAFIDWFIGAEKHLLSTSSRAPKAGAVHRVLVSNAFKTHEELSGLA